MRALYIYLYIFIFVRMFQLYTTQHMSPYDVLYLVGGGWWMVFPS